MPRKPPPLNLYAGNFLLDVCEGNAVTHSKPNVLADLTKLPFTNFNILRYISFWYFRPDLGVRVKCGNPILRRRIHLTKGLIKPLVFTQADEIAILEGTVELLTDVPNLYQAVRCGAVNDRSTACRSKISYGYSRTSCSMCDRVECDFHRFYN